jgi:3-oxoadipate enol-lactonase
MENETWFRFTKSAKRNQVSFRMITKVAHLAHRSVRYLETGGGRALVLLHAFPLSADQWLPQMQRVPPGWRVLAPDLRGFRGGSVAYEDTFGAMTIDDYADDVLAWMAHVEVDRAVVAGVSMGGYIALSIAARAPQRLAGLVLANTRATPDSDDARAARARMLTLISEQGPAGVAREMLPKLLGETTRREQPDLVDVVDRMVRVNTSEALAAAVGALRDRPDRTAMLPAIACPTAVMTGNEETVIPIAEAEMMQRAIPSATLDVIPRVGHLSNLEAPQAFSDVMWRRIGRPA